jgi:hypothetical protein
VRVEPSSICTRARERGDRRVHALGIVHAHGDPAGEEVARERRRRMKGHVLVAARVADLDAQIAGRPLAPRPEGVEVDAERLDARGAPRERLRPRTPHLVDEGAERQRLDESRERHGEHPLN